MSKSIAKNQSVAITCAVIAAFLFAYFESMLGDIATNIGIEAYIAFRLVFTSGVYFLILWLFSLRRNSGGLVFSPKNIDMILYVRGFITVIYLTCLAVAFYGGKSQALTYPFFFLHPIWQFFAARMINKKWPSIKRQAAPIALILIGALVFAVSHPKNHTEAQGWWQQFFEALPSYAPALLAGIGFAYTNEMSTRISERCNEYPYKFVGGVTIERMDGLRITAYTTYASILILPIMLPIMTIILKYLGMSTTTLNLLQSEQLPSYVSDLSLACLIVAVGTWAITEAFARAKHTTQIAALDGLLIPLAAGLDYLHGRLPTDDPNFVYMAGALFLILVGAVWSAFRPEAS
ncbi:hypothetical protein F6476_01140 [Pseudomonas umsongensis]|uniref:EamA-like transporter family protein n=1 Tax=Pseudomonas migulae TaxID=78543 RepID=A0A1H5FI34_9PSED|nr:MULTISPECIES: hypothetical protein [Pseudomonas]MBU0520785.1 hypothetical protein [Gammaproteobacteria bacterium]SEB88063.1 hypothetical protein SAMN04490199_3067 [Pseudomonas marginalis]KRP75702.1 hypothetical protein TU80_19600 [Pseudomonas veronii]MBU0844513.1 hypothetical protein [Gammaproteobacteria bacterium]MBU1840201.1 hypothetical protein [Gammaproteobacteria bacterium]